MTDHVIIVGAGHAAGQAAASLRAEGYEGPLTLIGEEAYLPYQRPPLSKKFLAGEIEFDRLYFKPPEFYEQANVAVRLNCEVTAIDRSTHELSVQDLTTSHVETVPYSKVILATGGRVRTLSMSGAELDGVHVFAADGTLIGRIALPERCANVCFGGKKRNRLFMTASQSLYAVYVETKGAHIT